MIPRGDTPGGAPAVDNRRGEHRRRWYLLDNLARLFPPIRSPKYTTLFRVSAVLSAPVQINALHVAQAVTWERFPEFHVHLRRGVFWHYLEECAPGLPKPDNGMPCMEVPRYRGGEPLLTVYVRRRRITVETTHILTDGTGALAFLRALLVAYSVELSGGRGSATAVQIAAEARAAEIPLPGEPPPREELEYASRRYYERRLPHPQEFSRAWHVDGRRLATGVYHVTSLAYPTQSLREIARGFQAGLTDILLAVFVKTLAERYHAASPPRLRRRPIRILIPVNMRPHTGSRTMRNFFVFVMIELDQRLGRYGLDEIVTKVHHQLRAELDPRSLRRQITRNVRAERNVLIRVSPVFAKDIVLRVVHRLQGEAVNTASFSNLGAVELPESMGSLVERLEFVPPPSAVTGVNMTIISYGGTTAVTFGSTRREHDIEQDVAKTLHRLGAQGVLRTNWRRHAGEI
ncbi:MAG: hypothetical protein WD492_07455 [Alkalispirochaeta sp.]